MSDRSSKILIVGLQPYDAGKTTLCKGLIYGLKEVGVTVVPFKPHSGISHWSQFDAFQRSLMNGTLLSSDIMELEGVAQSQLPLEVLNPVNRLSGPAFDTGTPEEKLVFQEFMAERFTHHDGLAHSNVYYLNGTLNLSRLRDMQTFYLRIRRNAQKTIFIRNFEALVDAYSRNFDRATSSCYRCLSGKPLVVESFNDAAYPFNRAEDCDLVMCVSSSTVLWFDERKYFEAIELHARQKPKLQLTVSQVYSPSLVKQRFTVQPLNLEERSNPEMLAKNYSNVVSGLIKNV
jgi:predicted P-loop ATPase/GTPase